MFEKVEFGYQLRTAPKAPSDEGAGQKSLIFDWGRENERVQQREYPLGQNA